MLARTGVTQNLYRGFRTYQTVTETLLPGYLELLTPEQSDVLAPLHTLLVALVRFRKQAAERLFQVFQAAKEQVEKGEAHLPLLFSYEEELVTMNQQATTVAEVRLEKRLVTMHFRLWDHQQWVLKHADVSQDCDLILDGLTSLPDMVKEVASQVRSASTFLPD